MNIEKAWKYCVAGNIVKTHMDENGVRRYGTPAFTGGTKVYLCGKLWDSARDTISVLGLSRAKRWYVEDVPPYLIENVRWQRTFKPSVLKMMDHWEYHTCWWHDTKEDKAEVRAFVKRWNDGDMFAPILVLKQFYGQTLTEIKAYGTDRFDFTPNLLGIDFSVGQFGYAVFSFGESNIYISIDGLSTVVPPKNNVKELPIKKSIRDHFVGAILETIEYDGETYCIQFAGLEVLRGCFVPNDGHTDRSYFELEFPWI